MRVSKTETATIENLFRMLESDDKIIHVLKVMNQNVIATAVKLLYKNISARCPFKDGGNWSVHITFLDSGLVIKHIKNQKYITDTPVNHFEFSWELSFEFNKDLSGVETIKLRISDWCFNSQTSDSMKQAFLTVAKPFLIGLAHSKQSPQLSNQG